MTERQNKVRLQCKLYLQYNRDQRVFVSIEPFINQ